MPWCFALYCLSDHFEKWVQKPPTAERVNLGTAWQNRFQRGHYYPGKNKASTKILRWITWRINVLKKSISHLSSAEYLLLDGNSEHDAYAWMKRGLFGEKSPIFV